MIYEVVINGIVYRGTLEEIQQILADERENLGQYTLALWLSQRTISHTFFIHFKLLIEMEKLLEDLSSLGESLQNSTTNEAIIQLHQFLQKHLYVKDIVEFHGRYAVKLNNNLTLYYNSEITHR